MVEIDNIDKRLLNILQNDFPIVENPFVQIGKILNISEDEIIYRIKTLKDEKKVIRQISPIFDSKKLGYKSSLIACKLTEEEIDKKAEIINEHPGVSHNYKRDCEYNLWFTIAVSPHYDLEEKCKELLENANITDFMILPALKMYKLGVKFDLESDVIRSNYDSHIHIYNNESNIKDDLKEKEIDYIKILQDDLPLVHSPFKIIAQRNNISQNELINSIKQFLKEGKMRRFSAILNHRNAGFLFNAMVVWNVPEEKIDEYGAIISGFESVSHCYKRPTFPNWHYSLYSMIHARTEEIYKNVVDLIVKKINPYDFKMLLSLKEYKKERIRYFI